MLPVSSSLVTIGLTCFNAADTIARAIASAQAQDWPSLEILIVDDVSADGSVAAIELAIAGDARARLIRHGTNQGPAGARTTILREAKGSFVAFFDDDDESLPNRIATQVRRIERFEAERGTSLVACYAGGERHYPNGYVKRLPAIGSVDGQEPNGPGLADYLLVYRRRPEWFYGSGIPASALMARKSVFDSAGGFDAGLRRVEDADFAIRLAMLGGYFIGTPESLFIQHSTSAPDKSPEKNLQSQQRLAEKNASYLRQRGLHYYAIHWPKLRYWHFKRNYPRFALELMGLVARNPVEVSRHLLATGPSRLLHERRMRRSAGR